MFSPEYGKFRSYRLPTASWCSQQHIVVRVVECVEHLSLHGVEVGELVQLLVAGVIEGRDRERVKVKKIRVWWVDLRQDQVFEGNGHHSLCMQPAIRENTDKVLRGKWFKDRYSEGKLLYLLSKYLESRQYRANTLTFCYFVLRICHMKEVKASVKECNSTIPDTHYIFNIK